MAILLIFEVIALLVLRKKLAYNLVQIIRILGGSQSQAVWFYALISLPGVLSHEISHFLYAAFLGLRTGAIELLPQMDSDGGVDLGSVQVESKDPFRSSLVGLAPLISGLALVAWLSSMFQFQLTKVNVLLMYLIMTISLHMVPSKRDMASWPVVALLFFLFWGAFIMLGYTIPTIQPVLTTMGSIIDKTVYGLGVAVLFGLIVTVMEYIGLLMVVQLRKRSYAKQ